MKKCIAIIWIVTMFSICMPMGQKAGQVSASEEFAIINPTDMNIGWYYNCGTGPFSYRVYKDVGFVPMIWGTGADGSIPQIAADGYKYLLAYNELDMGNDVGGSNIDVATVVDHWDNLLGYDFYLGAPAPALSPSWDNGV